MSEITPPIFVLYKGDKLVAFDAVFEAEMTPVEHFERIERVLDAAGRELGFSVKQQYAARLEATASPDEQRLRELLIWALQELGDIDVKGLATPEIVERALESFRLRKESDVDWSRADWSPLFDGLLSLLFSR